MINIDFHTLIAASYTAGINKSSVKVQPSIYESILKGLESS